MDEYTLRTTAPQPWQPMTDAIALKHLGKLIEELTECGSAASRCVIQGVDECEPVTGKPNREWLEDEIADVLANAELVMEHFKLDVPRILKRRNIKKEYLRNWHNMAAPLKRHSGKRKPTSEPPTQF